MLEKVEKLKHVRSGVRVIPRNSVFKIFQSETHAQCVQLAELCDKHMPGFPPFIGHANKC